MLAPYHRRGLTRPESGGRSRSRPAVRMRRGRTFWRRPSSSRKQHAAICVSRSFYSVLLLLESRPATTATLLSVNPFSVAHFDWACSRRASTREFFVHGANLEEIPVEKTGVV